MKKLILAFGLLFALSLTSCFSEENAQNKEQADTTKVELTADVPTDVEVTGVAVDGAMNSISLLVGDDTVFFSYLTPRNLLFTLGMTLFLGCDLFVAVNNAALYLDLSAYPALKALHDIPFNMMWAFYGPSQMLLSLSSAGGKR